MRPGDQIGAREPLRPHRSAANELAGRFYGARGFETSATVLKGPALLSALGCRRQGAATRSALYPPFPARTRIGLALAISEHIERLELETVLKALQAVSGEIVLERVIETLLHLAIEHAGADRGMLLLTSGAGLLMQAEATVDRGTLGASARETGFADDLAESVVTTSRARRTPSFWTTRRRRTGSRRTYTSAGRARSILCLPLIKQGRLVAVLYLENHLRPLCLRPRGLRCCRCSRRRRRCRWRTAACIVTRAAEAKIRRLVDANIVGVAITRVDGKSSTRTMRCLEIVGYTPRGRAIGTDPVARADPA